MGKQRLFAGLIMVGMLTFIAITSYGAWHMFPGSAQEYAYLRLLVAAVMPLIGATFALTFLAVMCPDLVPRKKIWLAYTTLMWAIAAWVVVLAGGNAYFGMQKNGAPNLILVLPLLYIAFRCFQSGKKQIAR